MADKSTDEIPAVTPSRIEGSGSQTEAPPAKPEGDAGDGSPGAAAGSCGCREDLRQYRGIVSATPDGIALLGRDYRYLIVNRTYELISGRPREEIIGRSVAEYLGEKVFRDSVKPRFDQCLQGEVVSYRDWFFYPAAGKRFVEVTYTPYRDSDDRIAGVMAITRDVTDRRLTEEALERSRQGLALRGRIANAFLTTPKDHLFSEVLNLLLKEFDSGYGYLGYIDERGDLVCPSMTRDVWHKCRVPEKSIVFPRQKWGGLWGISLVEGRSMLQNESLRPPKGHVPVYNTLIIPMKVNGELFGQIALANKSGGYTGDDKLQLEDLAEFIAPIMRIYLDKEKAAAELRAHATKLQEKNTALKVLLENRDEEKQMLVDSILNNFQRLVFPYHEKLRACRRQEDLFAILGILEANTHQSLSPLKGPLPLAYRSFTPTEIQVADLVKAGKTGKEIAGALNLSLRTVFFHRNNIRKKLDIQNTKANLKAHLLSLSE
jgi:PAS domain S-box-containing protein